MNFKAILIGAAFAIAAPFTASALTLTTFDVNPNSGSSPTLSPETGIADGGQYSDLMTIGDSVSIDIRADDADDTDGVLGFAFVPSPLRTHVDIALSNTDFNLFGDMTISLATNADGTGVFATSAPISSAGLYSFFNVESASPVYVVWSWENNVTGSFNTDVSLNQIPVPAGIMLMGTALAGFGVMRRRKKRA